MMNKILYIHLENDSDAHEDLVFSIKGLLSKQLFDSYYLWDEAYWNKEDGKRELAEVELVLARLLKMWKEQVSNLSIGNMIYLPIDFSDQYTGCIKVLARNNDLELQYGHTLREGWSIKPSDPGDFFNAITDFKTNLDKTLKVTKEELLADIEVYIEKFSTPS